MKLYNLSASTSSPCIVMKFKSCTIMFDCALDYSALFNFLPLSLLSDTAFNMVKWKLKDENGRLVTDQELKECSGKVFVDSSPEFNLPEMNLIDLSSVDIILVSNSANIAALPYITEYCGFRGTVYATEPTHQIGRLLMEELVEFCQNLSKSNQATKWKNRKFTRQLPSSLADVHNHNVLSWRHCYSYDDLQASLSRVNTVRFAEKVNIFGALHVTAYSSGFSLGSANWLVESEYEKITYMSSSSTLTTHPQPFDSNFLNNSDLLIFTGLTQAPTHNPDSMLTEFCSCLAKTVKAGGNVLVPCQPHGLLYDLLEYLLPYMEQTNLINIPIYLVSPSAKASLALSQIYAEWLHPSKQNKAYLPEPPFSHDELIQLGRLKIFHSVSDILSSGFKKPCIVFAGHPSLRFGDAVHFVKMWGNSPSNSFIFVEPGFSHLEALAPFSPINARVFHLPIDTRINYQAATRMIDGLTPRRVVAPSSYLKPPLLSSHRTDLVLNLESPLIELLPTSVVNVKLQRSFEKVDLEPELAASLLPTEVNGVLVAPVSMQVVTRDNHHLLKVAHKRPVTGRKRKFHEEACHRPLVCGKLKVEKFVDNLKQEGFGDVKIEDSQSGKIVILQDTIIQVDQGSTHIVCEGNETLRVKLRDVLLKSLHGT